MSVSASSFPPGVDTFERSGLDAETRALVRIAALVSMDAAPVSYMLNVGAAADPGVSAEQIQGTLVAIAAKPISCYMVTAGGADPGSFAKSGSRGAPSLF
jgi:hypothetical protein